MRLNREDAGIQNGVVIANVVAYDVFAGFENATEKIREWNDSVERAAFKFLFMRSVFREEPEEVCVALDNTELLVHDYDRGGHLLQERVSLLLGQLACIGGAHHALRVARDKGTGELATRFVAAAATV